jgi:hypothetical protein
MVHCSCRLRSAIEASQLREKTAAMAERIHQLEEALTLAHAKTSTEIHSLLIPNEDGGGEHSSDTQGLSSSQNDVIDAFGTLSIGSDGRSKYHNQSAGADVSLLFIQYIQCFSFSTCCSTSLR